MLAEPKSAAQIKNLAESLDLFDFAPGAHTPEEYGKYMIRQSGHFEYDENLDAFYDYEKYGTERMNAEDGMFTDRGYIAYKGYYSMEEVMNGSQSSRMDFEKYGQDCMENDCVTQTEFGLLRRLEPPFPEPRQGQRMM